MNYTLHTIDNVADLDRASLRQGRFLSLDVFRGLTVALMIIVNSPGKGAPLYPYLVHAPWLGFTLADWVFPSFLFAVGNAMSFSLQKIAHYSHAHFLRKVIRRTVIVFVIGYLMYWFPFVQQAADGSWMLRPIETTRIMGVLQRIAICYLAASVLIRFCSLRVTQILAAVILLTYWLLLYLFGDSGAALTMEGNAITKLDVFLFGESHIYMKDRIPFDPEGLLSTLPAVVNVLAGYWTGVFLQQKGKSYECLLKLMIAGSLLITAALAWDIVFPISKKLWTSSFVLYTIGIDMLVLCVLIYAIEIRRCQHGVAFFNVFGKNPLVIYLLSELLLVTLNLIPVSRDVSLFQWIGVEVFQRIAPGPAGALITAIAFMFLCWLVGWAMDRRGIYVRI